MHGRVGGGEVVERTISISLNRSLTLQRRAGKRDLKKLGYNCLNMGKELVITDWKRNILVYKIDTVINWFYVPIGVWVLVWSRFLSFQQIFLATGIGLFWGTILELPSGALADMIGRKKTVILGRLIIFLGYIFLFFRHDFLGLIIWGMAVQTDSAFTSGANSALLYDSLKENNKVKEHYKKTEADTFMYNTIGMAIGSIIGGFLFKITPMAPYTLMIPVTGLGLVAATFYQEPKIDSVKWSIKNYIRQNIDGFKHVFENTKIRAVSFFSVVVNLVAFSGVWYLYEPRLAAGGFDSELLATLVSVTYLMRALGTRLIPIVDSKIAKHQTPLFLAIFQTAGSALSFIGGKFGAITCVFSRKLSDGYRQPTLLALQNEQIDSKYRATALSALSLTTNLFLAILGIWIGLGIDKLGSELMIGFYAILGVLVVIPLGWNLSKVMKKF